MKTIKREDVYVAAVLYNEAAEAAYRKALQELVRKMAQEALSVAKSHYKDAAEEIGMDEDPIVLLRRALKRFGDKWIKRFDNMSADVAQMFADRASRNLDSAFKKKLKDAGFTVRFKPTKRMLSAYRAVVAENVNLIRSIPSKFLTNVQSVVWANVTKGYDLKSLSQSLQKEYGITHRRAALIARDQAAKAKAVFEESRRSELGITEAEWRHSHAGKKPRPSHVAMHGHRYEIKKGMWDPDENKFVWPGMLINCRCRSRSIITQ